MLMKKKSSNMILGNKNNIIKILLGVIVSMIFVYYAIKDFNLGMFKDAILNVNYSFIFISSFLLIFTVYLRALRWKILLNKECSTNFIYKSQLIGYFGNNILPLRMGELLRSYLVGEKYSLSKAEVFGSIVLERVLDMFATGVFIILLFLSNVSFFLNISSVFYYAFVIICIVGILGLLLSYKKINFSNKPNNTIIIIFKNIYTGFTYLNRSNIIKVLLFTLFIWSIYVFQVHLMQKAFSLNMSIYQSLILLVISTAVISIPALPGNFGTFEGSVVYSLSLFNIVDNFGFSFILHLISFIPFTILGMIYFFQNLKFFKNKNISLND